MGQSHMAEVGVAMQEGVTRCMSFHSSAPTILIMIVLLWCHNDIIKMFLFLPRPSFSEQGRSEMSVVVHAIVDEMKQSLYWYGIWEETMYMYIYTT